MTMAVCLIFDFVIFLILAINLCFGPPDTLIQVEISTTLSCLMFGFMFDILGRKQIFIMRVMVSSISTALIPFIPYKLVACLALVMSSVSLTIPVIPDLVKFNKRGLTYAYLGLLFAMAMLIVFVFIELELHNAIETKWIFLSVGIFGVVIDLTLCWGFQDSYKT